MSLAKGGFIGPLPRGQRDGRVTEALREKLEMAERGRSLLLGGGGIVVFVRHYGRAHDKRALSLAHSGSICSTVIVFVVSTATEGR